MFGDGSGTLAWNGWNHLPRLSDQHWPKYIVDDTIPSDTIIAVDLEAYQPRTATSVTIDEANKRAKHMAVYGRGMGKTAAMAKAFGMGQKKLNEMIFGEGKVIWPLPNLIHNQLK